jgi:hypothetical protein
MDETAAFMERMCPVFLIYGCSCGLWRKTSVLWMKMSVLCQFMDENVCFMDEKY